MPIDVASLPRRSVADLRTFVRSQRLRVQRLPDAVAQAEADDETYWRFLVRRAPLEGVCAYYQTYDAWGDENDWNLNIAPDPAYEWMLDPAVLYALSLCSGAPCPIDLDEIKVKAGSLVIECELTPDDSLYDKFVTEGLPIQSGGTWPNKGDNEHEGPEGERVGVYGVFCGDYGHGGRPEIHPFDAFWRQRHIDGRALRISWELGVFQDDSNRFNGSWSQAPIDVEFRVPFCIDIPVTQTSAISTGSRFALRESDLCSESGKNVQSRGAADYVETFTARTVRLNSSLENRAELSVRDQTGLAGRPFAIGLEDVRYTSIGWPRWFRRAAWLSGWIVVRVTVNQDGFAYWNLSGPNSPTAADAEGWEGTVAVPEVVVADRAPARVRRPRPFVMTEARPILETVGARGLAVEVTVAPEGDESRAGRTLTLRPRETQLVDVDRDGVASELESFDLFARATIRKPEAPASRLRADIRESILRLAGLYELGRGLPKQDAIVEVDDVVTIGLGARYAPYRDGKVQGEERSMVADALTRADTGPVDYRFDVTLLGPDADRRRVRVATTEKAEQGRQDRETMRIDRRNGSDRLVIGSLGTTPTVQGVAEDRFGLQAPLSAVVANFRVVDARRWLEGVTGMSLNGLRRQLERLEKDAAAAPSDERIAAAAKLRALVDVITQLDVAALTPAAQLAGTLRLADYVLSRPGSGRSLAHTAPKEAQTFQGNW